ncbi:hypothetical protein A0N72_04145 [Campylobacter lari]|nr:hypothetical protein [Campylobacter lari]
MQKFLESYGILVQENIKDKNVEIDKNTITIHNSNISEIDLNILKQKQINKITITNCEINYIYFTGDNNIELFFTDCVFKNQIIAIAVIFNKEVIFSRCIFEKRINFAYAIFNSYVDLTETMFKNEVRFIMTQFLADQTTAEIIENNFSEAVFKDKASFAMVKFKARVSFNMTHFEGKARFIDTSFFKNTVIFSEVEFNNIKFISSKKRDISSINDTVKQTYHFQDITFKGIVNFKNIYIKDLNFKNVIFNNIVVFDNAALDNKPKFTNCTFSNQFNIKHDCIQYDYNELKEKNKNTYNEFLNFRDLFRKLKSNRIAHHNLIDASELRAQARELELKHKENKNLKDTIEQWQLFFYRKLCDHHTDLILNVKWLATTITVFLCLYFFSKYGLNFQHFINEYNNNSIIKYININFIYKFESYNGFIFIFYTYILIFMLWNVFRIFFSFAVILCCIINQPKLIFGIANLIRDNSYNAFENLLITIYTLIAGLIIFSLQKTARKNTIIPN